MRDVEKCLVAFFLGAVIIGLPVAVLWILKRGYPSSTESSSVTNYEEWEVIRDANGRIEKLVMHRKVEGA